MSTALSAILSAGLQLLLAALVIFVVSKLNLGLKVKDFASALIAAAVIAVVTLILGFILVAIFPTFTGAGLWGSIVALVVAAVILLISDRFVKGMKVDGFVGALVAAAAIAVVTWLANWLIGLFS